MPEHIIVSKHDGYIATVQLNRPKVLNALNLGLMVELVEALESLDGDPDVRCIVIHGDDRAFAAGADITEMAEASPVDMLMRDQFTRWDRIRRVKTPLIAAVSGFALGGGCELAMHCDIIIAGQSARFGQPEVKVGIMPGAGGTQRLTRAVGKFRANLYLMSGRTFDAPTALTMGLVSEVVADAEVESAALKLAGEIAALPPLSLKFIKEATALADNAPLDAALEFERRACQFLFSTADKNEGMSAFLEKRKPGFAGR